MTKQKLKTNKAIAKKIKITKNGKMIHAKGGRNHLLTNKGRNNRIDKYGKGLSIADSNKIQALLPYGI